MEISSHSSFCNYLLKMFLSCLILILLITSPHILAQLQYHDVPQKTRPTRINIESLQPAGDYDYVRPRIETLNEFYSAAQLKDFIVTMNYEQTCQSVLREGYQCYELNNTQIGYVYQLSSRRYLYPVSGGYFASFSSNEVQIFFNSNKNQYYIRPSKRLYEAIFGPFIGEPLAEFKKAALPLLKDRNYFPGTKLTYLSKRWEFSNEKDAMVPRCGRYDFVGGSPSGREIEDGQLNSQFFRFRLENNSEKNLFVLYNRIEPEVFRLEKYPSQTRWIESSLKSQVLDGLNWVSLPKNSAIEFETKTGCSLKKTCAIGVYLNDEMGFGDEVETIASYPSNKPREFSKENAPPKERISSF